MKNYLETKFKNKKILILGFAREGQSTYKILKKYLPGVEIAIADQDENLKFADNSIKSYLGPEYLKHLKDFNIIVKSPGISSYKPEIIDAIKSGVEITSQTKIFFDVCQSQIIGITGTKGKSTTSTLLYQIIKNAGLKTVLVGNIGNPVLDTLETNTPDTVYVFELSSHQLYDLDKSSHIAIVTNVSVDHLDWYGNFENYVDAKTHILKFQSENDFAILNYDNLITREFDRFSKGKLFYTSKNIKTDGAFVEKGIIYLNIQGKIEELGNTKELSLIGQHNWDNIMQASVAAKIIGIDNQNIWNTVKSFKQLEHHLEFVRKLNGISFYNDSFAVDQIATSAAINSFFQDITLILGGFERGIDYTEITNEIASKPNIKNIIVIGEIAAKIVKSLRKSKYPGNIIKLGSVKIDKIVKTAVKHTLPGGVVLLSPAAASFDMFKDYKDRGNQFKKAVNEL